MKKLSFLMIGIFVIAMVTMAHAENKANVVSITPFAGGYFFDNTLNFRSSPVFGLRAGYNFTENFTAEGFFSGLRTEIKALADEPGHSVFGFGLEALYHFFPRERFVPFVAVGVGGMHYDGHESYDWDKFAFDYGAGMKFFVTENVALRADVRHVMPLSFSGNSSYNDFAATFGININLVDQKTQREPEKISLAKVPAPLKKVVDSDGDSVPDEFDKCPGTPAGVRVDSDGCPQVTTLDSDRDGVPDHLDKCPGTPASVVVDRDGCPPDTDGDGVPDYLDQCPETPRGVAVDKYGCPKISSTDSDRDGVPDYLDRCPGTPYGIAVDKDGCPVPEKEPLSMRLKLEFAPGKSAIKRMYHSELKTVADFLKAHPGATATIVGHTDDVGNRQSNIRLSQARADSVKQYLVSRFGIKSNRIKTMGYGPDKPIASNKTKEGRQTNRRVIAYFETAP